MKINIETGISMKIEGELGKHQTISIDKLIEIGQSFQDLLMSLVKYDIPANQTIDIDNFKIDLSAFSGGSAIPTFIFTPNVKATFHDYKDQRKQLSEKANDIFTLMDSGEYLTLAKQYPDYVRRNEMVEKIFNFSKSFGNSPVQFGRYDFEKNVFKKAYTPIKFSPRTKQELIVKVNDKAERLEEMAFAEVKITSQEGKNKKTRVQSIVKKDNHSLSYSPTEIFVRNKKYILNFPLRSLFETEDDIYIIKNELLDLIGTGDTEKEAEQNFNEEFDYLYTKLQSLKKNQLSTRMQNILSSFNLFIKEII